MALLDSEVYRLKFELGYTVLTILAEPRIDYVAIFDQVIKPYTEAGALTTSGTTVTAATSATPVTLTLASATGFTAGDRVAIDVDDRYESAIVEVVTGSTITVLLSKAHAGTYPVTVEGGEVIIRSILYKLEAVRQQIVEAISTAGIKRVNKIEFFGSSTQTTQLTSLKSIQMLFRDELASAVGVPNMWRNKFGTARAEMY